MRRSALPSCGRFNRGYDSRNFQRQNELYVTISVVILREYTLISAPGRNPITKFKRKPPPPDPDEILKKVTESTDKFERALGNARDQTIEATNRVGQYNAIMATNIHRDLTRYGEDIEHFGTEVQGQYTQVATNMKLLTAEATHVRKGIDDNGAFLRQESERNEIWRTEFQESIEDKILGALKRMNGIAARENAMQDDQLNSRNELLGILLAQMKSEYQFILQRVPS